MKLRKFKLSLHSWGCLFLFFLLNIPKSFLLVYKEVSLKRSEKDLKPEVYRRRESNPNPNALPLPIPCLIVSLKLSASLTVRIPSNPTP